MERDVTHIPARVTFQLPLRARRELEKAMRRRGFRHYPEILRLAVEAFLEGEVLGGFEGSKARSAYQEGVRRGTADVLRAVATLVRRGPTPEEA